MAKEAATTGQAVPRWFMEEHELEFVVSVPGADGATPVALLEGGVPWCVGDPLKAILAAGRDRHWAAWKSSRSQGQWARQCDAAVLAGYLRLVRRKVPQLMGFVLALSTNCLGLADSVATFFRRGDAARSCPLCSSAGRPGCPETLAHMLGTTNSALSSADTKPQTSKSATHAGENTPQHDGTSRVTRQSIHDDTTLSVHATSLRTTGHGCVSYAAKCYAARCARHAAYSGLAHDASLCPVGGGDRLVAGDILVGS